MFEIEIPLDTVELGESDGNLKHGPDGTKLQRLLPMLSWKSSRDPPSSHDQLLSLQLVYVLAVIIPPLFLFLTFSILILPGIYHHAYPQLPSFLT